MSERDTFVATGDASPEPAPALASLETKLKNPFWLGILLAGAVIAFYFSAGTLGFINYDDPDYVTRNYQVLGGLSWGGAAWAFGTGHASNWHPATWLSHMLDAQLFGMHPAGHHLVSVAVHVGNSVLLFFFLRFITGATWRSLCVAAFFGLHPMHVESVAWVSERKDLLSTFFGLLCLWAYAAYGFHSGMAVPVNRGKREQPGSASLMETRALKPAHFYLLALLFYAIGLMSKPMLVTWPCVMLLLDYWPLQRFELGNWRLQLPVLQRVVLEKIPFLALAAGSCAVTLIVQQGAMAGLAPVPITARLSNAIVAYVGYIGKLAWPGDLAIIYPFVKTLPALQVWASALLIVGMTVLVLWQGPKRRYLVTGWAWYLGTLVPVIGLVQVGRTAMADRYTYLTATGLFIMLVWGVAEWVKRRPALRLSAAVAALVLITACGLGTQRQLPHWRNSVALFRHAVAVTQNNAMAYNHLGLALAEAHRNTEAEACYREALRLDSSLQHAWNNLGCLLADTGRYAEAVTCFQAALALDPNLASAYNNMGTALLNQGKTTEAIAAYSAALRLQPLYPEAHFNLANALLAQGETARAEQSYKRAVQQAPAFADARNNLGVLLFRQGRLSDAATEFSLALQADPGSWEAAAGLAEAYAAGGLQAEAAPLFLKAAQGQAAAGRREQALRSASRAKEFADNTGQRAVADKAGALGAGLKGK